MPGPAAGHPAEPTPLVTFRLGTRAYASSAFSGIRLASRHISTPSMLSSFRRLQGGGRANAPSVAACLPGNLAGHALLWGEQRLSDVFCA